MTKKQKRKIAQEIVQYELIRSNPDSTKDEINEAEKMIFLLTNKIISVPNGLELMVEIDDLVQELLSQNIWFLKNNLL